MNYSRIPQNYMELNLWNFLPKLLIYTLKILVQNVKFVAKKLTNILLSYGVCAFL